MDALWHFRYRWPSRPLGWSSLSVDPDSGVLDVVPGDDRALHGRRVEAALTEARWHDAATRGVSALRDVELESVAAPDGLAEWHLDLGDGPEGTRPVPVLAGFEVAFDANPGPRLAEISVYTTIPAPDGRVTAGVSVTTGRREAPAMHAGLTLAVLAVPSRRLEVHTPSSDASRAAGIEARHPPLAATIASQRVRPLGIAAFSFELSSGRPERSAPRHLRELGVSINGLVLRWHVSTAGLVTRGVKVRATATVPCVRLD